jgi:hypothetical protein
MTHTYPDPPGKKAGFDVSAIVIETYFKASPLNDDPY